jgi:hypothetical protein
MKIFASFLFIFVLLSAFYLVLFSPFKDALPQTIVIAVTIIVSVALFGTVFALFQQRRNLTK